MSRLLSEKLQAIKARAKTNAVDRARERGETLGEDARLIAQCSARALRENYDTLVERARGQTLLPMVKANAYGHGMEWVVRQLEAHAGRSNTLEGYGVATLDEGSVLRRILGPKGRNRRILVFSGALPWSDAVRARCENDGLTPVIASDEAWSAFIASKAYETLSYEIKFNTGMNRLGLSLGFLSQVEKILRTLPVPSQPSGVMTHFAVGDDPEHPLTKRQLRSWEEIVRRLKPLSPALRFHAANSAALWNLGALALDGQTDFVRPGLSLYGITPWPKAASRGLTPVMSLRALVAHVSRLQAGDSVGYGASFKAKEAMHLAVLQAGYGDGLLRSLQGASVRLSTKGAETDERIIGRVSMDLMAITCTPKTRPGDWAQILGPGVDLWSMATGAGSIPYEVLTSLSSRVHREYGE